MGEYSGRVRSYHVSHDGFSCAQSTLDKWSDGTCEHCFGRLVETIHTYHIRGFAVQIPWEEYDRRLSRSVKKIFTKHPYVLAFDTVITELLRVMYLMPWRAAHDVLSQFIFGDEGKGCL